MWNREQWRAFIDHPVTEWAILAVGVVLIILSPLAGVLPGPGGLFVFALGLAMVLKTSMWAKRRYVHFKRWQPKAGQWADWGLRRRSAKRREAMRKSCSEQRLALSKEDGLPPPVPLAPEPPFVTKDESEEPDRR